MDVPQSDSATSVQLRDDARLISESWEVGGPKRLTHFPKRITAKVYSTLSAEEEDTPNAIPATSVRAFVHRRGQLQPGDLEMEFGTDTRPAPSSSLPPIIQTSLPAYAFAYDPPAYNHPTHTQFNALTTTLVVGLPPSYSRGRAVDALRSILNARDEAGQFAAGDAEEGPLETRNDVQDAREEAENTMQED